MRWRAWFELGEQVEWGPLYSLHGIYRVRATTPDGQPISIPRIGGTDPEGILNIGRSGVRTRKTNRSLGQRLWEFAARGRHSGAYTYSLATERLSLLPAFTGHRIWASVVILPDEEILQAEQNALHAYFARYCELPPYNAAFPGR